MLLTRCEEVLLPCKITFVEIHSFYIHVYNVPSRAFHPRKIRPTEILALGELPPGEILLHGKFSTPSEDYLPRFYFDYVRGDGNTIREAKIVCSDAVHVQGNFLRGLLICHENTANGNALSSEYDVS